MKVIRSNEFTGEHAWEALNVAVMNDIAVKIHWADQPFQWHINDGDEVLSVLDGTVDMYYRQDGIEKMVELKQGDTFYADHGEAHSAHPKGIARVLVVEKIGSI